MRGASSSDRCLALAGVSLQNVFRGREKSCARVESARAERLRAVVRVCVVLDDETELALDIVSEDTENRTGALRHVYVTADRRHDLFAITRMACVVKCLSES